MAISTYKTFLMTSEDGASLWTKLIDIKEFPDLGGAPELLETTTLSDKMQTFIPGIQSNEALEFTANYSLDDYKKIQALAGQNKHFAVWFGGTDGTTPTGDQGKYKFQGEISAHPVGGGANEVVNMTITIVPSTPIELDPGK